MVACCHLTYQQHHTADSVLRRPSSSCHVLNACNQRKYRLFSFQNRSGLLFSSSSFLLWLFCLIHVHTMIYNFVFTFFFFFFDCCCCFSLFFRMCSFLLLLFLFIILPNHHFSIFLFFLNNKFCFFTFIYL